jgi:hypothetical protein
MVKAKIIFILIIQFSKIFMTPIKDSMPYEFFNIKDMLFHCGI